MAFYPDTFDKDPPLNRGGGRGGRGHWPGGYSAWTVPLTSVPYRGDGRGGRGRGRAQSFRWPSDPGLVSATMREPVHDPYRDLHLFRDPFSFSQLPSVHTSTNPINIRRPNPAPAAVRFPSFVGPSHAGRSIPTNEYFATNYGHTKPQPDPFTGNSMFEQQQQPFSLFQPHPLSAPQVPRVHNNEILHKAAHNSNRNGRRRQHKSHNSWAGFEGQGLKCSWDQELFRTHHAERAYTGGRAGMFDARWGYSIGIPAGDVASSASSFPPHYNTGPTSASGGRSGMVNPMSNHSIGFPSYGFGPHVPGSRHMSDGGSNFGLDPFINYGPQSTASSNFPVTARSIPTNPRRRGNRASLPSFATHGDPRTASHSRPCPRVMSTLIPSLRGKTPQSRQTFNANAPDFIPGAPSTPAHGVRRARDPAPLHQPYQTPASATPIAETRDVNDELHAAGLSTAPRLRHSASSPAFCSGSSSLTRSSDGDSLAEKRALSAHAADSMGRLAISEDGEVAGGRSPAFGGLGDGFVGCSEQVTAGAGQIGDESDVGREGIGAGRGRGCG